MESLIVYDSPELNPLDFVEELVPPITKSENPVLFYDLSNLIKKIKYWNEKFPNIRPYYAVKSNCDPIVVKLMAKFGTGFDCASKNEIESVKSIGADPKTSVVYANTVKYTSHLIYAKEQNAELMTFDRESELEKIKEFYPGAKVLLRFAVVPKAAVFSAGEKFGCEETEVEGLLKTAKRLNLNIVGIAFHIGCGPQPEEYSRAIENASKLFKLGQDYGFDMKILDIGGGFPADKVSQLDPYVDAINSSLEKNCNIPDLTVISEPGRYLSNSAGTLYGTIQSKRLYQENGEQKVDYFINDGVFNSMRFWSVINEGIKLNGIRRSPKKSDQVIPTTIYGPTCFTGDVITKNLPMEEFNVGDLIIFENIGAYSTSMNCEFNGFTGPIVKYFVQKDDLKLVESVL